MKAVQRDWNWRKRKGAGDLDVGGLLRADFLEGMPPNIQDKLQDEAKAALKQGQGPV